MSVPQNILDALNAVQTDDDNRVAAKADNDAKTLALAQATADKSASDQGLQAAVAHEATDVAALKNLVDQVYGGGA